MDLNENHWKSICTLDSTQLPWHCPHMSAYRNTVIPSNFGGGRQWQGPRHRLTRWSTSPASFRWSVGGQWVPPWIWRGRVLRGSQRTHGALVTASDASASTVLRGTWLYHNCIILYHAINKAYQSITKPVHLVKLSGHDEARLGWK